MIAWDGDHAASELHYRRLRTTLDRTVLPLVTDLANPTPAVGWAHQERKSMLERADADTVVALALVHHLSISRNIPLSHIADFFARLAPNLIVEFIPKSDPKVGLLLETREDVFPDYSLDGFRTAFRERFEVAGEEVIVDSERKLFRMVRR